MSKMPIVVLESTLLLLPTSGSITIANSPHVFTGGIGKEFSTSEDDIIVADTPSVLVDVYTLMRRENFRGMYRAIGNPKELTLTQSQIVKFCTQYPSELHPNGFLTFFLFFEGESLRVAEVCAEGKMDILSDDFEKPGRWEGSCRHRIVVPRGAGSRHRTFQC